MPSRNTVKQYDVDAFYHVYNRGVNKRVIFKDSRDYAVFLSLLKRYLSKEIINDARGRPYVNLHEKLELLAFCLMPNHFHLLLYQRDMESITHLLHAVSSAYTVYFNRRYKRVGPLFQGIFKASKISTDDYVLHISRYIHLNPKEYKAWEFSSLSYYLGKKKSEWVRPERILDMFDSLKEYRAFLRDYEDQKRMMDELKYELADGI